MELKIKNRVQFINKLKFYLKGKNLLLKLKSLAIIATIPSDRLKFLQERYHDAPASPGYGKYLHIRYHMFIALNHIVRLGLHRSKNKSILDIGTGCGYFPYACQYYGHKCMSIDLGSNLMFNDFRELFKIPYVPWRIRKFKKLPDMGIKFDFITAFWVLFNIDNRIDYWGVSPDNRIDYWGVPEWEFFINDLKNNQLKENGKIFILLNREHHSKGRYYSEELHQFFLDSGAIVNGPMIYFE